MGVVLVVTSWGGTGAAAAAAMPVQETPIFHEDFESGLDAWDFPLGRGHRLVDDGAGGHALELQVGGEPVYAVIRGSEAWGDVRVEGRVLFPDSADAYLGFIYGFVDDGRRIDFGSVYIKSPQGYVQANHRFDTNVGRTLYPEYRASLDDAGSIRPGRWTRFALEVVRGKAHLYVGDMAEPVLTLPDAPTPGGRIGFEPRNPGSPVRIDDVVVRPLPRLTWRGAERPALEYRRSERLTNWEVLGPLDAHAAVLEATGGVGPDGVTTSDGRRVAWRPMAADARGVVLTGGVTEFRGGRRVAYFRTSIDAAEAGPALLEISSADAVALWVDGAFEGYGPSQGTVWWDAGDNPDHPPVRARVHLREGSNVLLVRVVGGVYTSGGFAMRVRR